MEQKDIEILKDRWVTELVCVGFDEETVRRFVGVISRWNSTMGSVMGLYNGEADGIKLA